MDLVRLFFGPNTADARGDVFFHFAYNGTKYDEAINADNVNSITVEPFLQAMLAQNYMTPTPNALIQENFYTFLKDVGRYHSMIDDRTAINDDTNGSKTVKEALFNKVYNSSTVPADVKKFFNTHLKVVRLGLAGTGGETVTEFSGVNLSSVRFNLVKVSARQEDREKQLFKSTIPLLPADILTTGLDAMTLQSAYQDGISSSYPISGETNFDFNIKTFIKNAILARDKSIKPSTTAAQPLEDLYESVVTGVRYARDDQNRLRVVGADGKLDMLKDFEGNELETALDNGAPNCASTGINSNCDFVYKCLLSGKPETLAECLKRLEEKDMFAVARKELNGMNPKVAVQLLRTFGFKPRRESGSNVVLPPTFDDWSRKLEKTLDAKTAQAIKGNRQLMEYLRAIVDMVRANPAIINTDFKNGALSDFARKTGLNVFRNPFPERKVAESVVDGLLFAPQQLAQSMQAPLALQIANIKGRMPFMMSGGGNAECPNANNLRQAFNMIFAEMEKNGKVLVESDKARINVTIEKLDKLESNLIQLMDDAKLFNKLNAALNPSQSVSTENVTLRDITDVRSQNITGETLGNLNDCIVKNLRDQTQLSSDLFNRVQYPLLQLLMKGGSNALSPVN